MREADRHLTTLITPSGCWRYVCAPQVFLSSGNGYNRRFDSIFADFDRKERIVDDTFFYDTDFKEHWWRTIDFLTTVGQAGIVLNSTKFQFSKRNVEFVFTSTTRGSTPSRISTALSITSQHLPAQRT